MKKDTKKVIKKRKNSSKNKNNQVEENKNIYEKFVIFGGVLVLAIILLVTFCDKKWELNGNIVSKGKVSYEIGDYYEYDESLDGTFVDLIDVKWKVMGVDDKGYLLLVSTSSVGDLTLGNNDDLLESMDDYLTGIDEMNSISKLYGRGKNAVYARSISMDDIFQVFDISEDIIPKFSGVSYSWGEDDFIHYEKVNENDEVISGISTIDHKGTFVFFDSMTNEWILAHRNNYSNDNMTIGALKTDYIMFNRSNYDYATGEYVDLFEEGTNIYRMLCKDERSYLNSYWVSNRYIVADENYASYGFNAFKNDSLNADYVVNSAGKTRSTTHGVRAVVAID